MSSLVRTFVPAMACVLCCAWPAAADEPELSRWRHICEVPLETAPAKGVVEFSLPDEVFAEARADLADLRLVGAGGESVPYVLRVDRGKAERSVSSRPVKMYNRTFLPGKQSSVTLDFGKAEHKSRIDVDTSGANFRRRVTVEASEDGRDWQVLRKTAWLFRIGPGGGRFEMNRVKLPDNDFRYLRVTVFNAPDDPEKLEIREVLSWRVQVKAAPPKTAAVEPVSTSVDQRPKKKATEIAVDLGFEQPPLYELDMSFDDMNFLRPVEILGRNRRKRTVLERFEDAPPRKREIDEPWRAVAGGTVYRFSGGDDKPQSSTRFRFGAGRARYRYLLVRIHNGDNAPLKFTGLKVRRFQYYLAFQAAGDGPHTLYLGNDAAAKPQYDLAHFIARLRAEGVTKIVAGLVRANPAFAEKEKIVPWSERHKGLLWVVLVAVLLVLGVLVVRRIRQVPPEE